MIKVKMFKKKECKKCKSKLSDKYDFCPYCGSRVEDDSKEWGMLGKNDFTSPMDELKLPMGFNMLFNSLMKNMTKQFAEAEKQMKETKEPSNKIKKDGISISISTFGDGPPRIRVSPMGNAQKAEVQEELPKVKQNLFSKEQVKKFSSLPREEAKTNIRRLSNKVIYELEMPEVESAEDISVVRLESSIEIKAIGKKKAYFKLIPISLPLRKYDLIDGKLVLELGIK